MSDRDAVMFVFGVCFAMVLYQTIDSIAGVLDGLRRPRVQWHVFGPEGANTTTNEAAAKNTAPSTTAAAVASGHIKATRP